MYQRWWRKMEDSNPQEVSLLPVFWTAALPLGESSVLPVFPGCLVLKSTRNRHFSQGGTCGTG